MRVLIRPEQIELHPRDGEPGVTGKITRSGYHGHDAVAHITIQHAHERQVLIVRTSGDTGFATGSQVRLLARGPMLVWPAPSLGESRHSRPPDADMDGKR